MNFQTNLLTKLSTLSGFLPYVKVTEEVLICKFRTTQQPPVLQNLLPTGAGFSLYTTVKGLGHWVNGLTCQDLSSFPDAVEVLFFKVPSRLLLLADYPALIDILNSLDISSQDFQFSEDFLKSLHRPPSTKVMEVALPVTEGLLKAFGNWDTEAQNTILEYAIWHLTVSKKS